MVVAGGAAALFANNAPNVVVGVVFVVGAAPNKLGVVFAVVVLANELDDPVEAELASFPSLPKNKPPVGAAPPAGLVVEEAAAVVSETRPKSAPG